MSSFPFSNGQLANGMRMSYIAQTAFNADLFIYTELTGTLSVNPSATSGNCPAGRVLRDNGKRLYPGAHPGVGTYMVGVLDPVSFLNGFIDPNAPVFAVYNTNKPASLDTTALAKGVNPNGGAPDLAPTVYTAGNIETTEGNLLVDAGYATVYGDITSTTGDITATAGDIIATAGDIIATAGDITATAGDIIATAGDIIATAGDITATAGDITATAGDITATAGDIIAAKQIRSGFNNTGISFDFSILLDNTIDISTYASQNIAVSASSSGNILSGCTIYFINGTSQAGDLIRLFVNVTTNFTLTFDSTSNVKNPPFTLPGNNMSVLTYVFNGTFWYLTSIVTGYA